MDNVSNLFTQMSLFRLVRRGAAQCSTSGKKDLKSVGRISRRRETLVSDFVSVRPLIPC